MCSFLIVLLALAPVAAGKATTEMKTYEGAKCAGDVKQSVTITQSDDGCTVMTYKEKGKDAIKMYTKDTLTCNNKKMTTTSKACADDKCVNCPGNATTKVEDETQLQMYAMFTKYAGTCIGTSGEGEPATSAIGTMTGSLANPCKFSVMTAPTQTTQTTTAKVAAAAGAASNIISAGSVLFVAFSVIVQ
jgi:hypothetical protein